MHQKRDALIKSIICDRLVKNFLDLIILCKLKAGPVYGYDLIRHIHDEFGVFLRPGTVYPVLYGLEKDGLIRSETVGKRKMYVLVDPLVVNAFFREFRNGCLKMLYFLDVRYDRTL